MCNISDLKPKEYSLYRLTSLLGGEVFCYRKVIQPPGDVFRPDVMCRGPVYPWHSGKVSVSYVHPEDLKATSSRRKENLSLSCFHDVCKTFSIFLHRGVKLCIRVM